ncbi:MAG TPA: TIGR03435 family protein [Candidatus Angelobacter sp.]
MSIRLSGFGLILRVSVVFLIAVSAFCQGGKSPLVFESIDIHVSKTGDQVTTLGVLPDGHVFFRNASPRKMIAIAYNLDESLVSGGPDWLDSDRLDVTARAAPTTSQAERLSMLQALLSERFKLRLRHSPKPDPIYVLTVGKDGPKLQPNSTPGFHDCGPAHGEAGQVHFQCHGNSMSDLAEVLPKIAPGYLALPVVDKTDLAGAYDFQLDWMGRGQYDAAAAAVTAGAAKDPLAVSIFDAVAKLGLSLEKDDNPKDTIVVDGAERVSAKSFTRKPDATSVPELTAEQLTGIDRFVKDEMQTEQVPGLAVGIYSRGQILLAKGYGLANVELNVPVKPETIFQSGSVGKQFVSAAVMMLVEEGKVGLDDSIVKYFANAPASWKPILVKNLLSHTSGLAEYETPERAGPKGPFYLRLDFTEDELVEKVEALPIDFAPGEHWSYRNTNYLLLGILIHKVTGKPYADYLQEKIFKPWYMTSTRLISEKDIIPNRSSGYQLVAHKLQNQDWVSPTANSTGDGTLYFNVLDLAKWDEALDGTSLLKQSSLDRTWTVFPLNSGQPNNGNYGFAWNISTVNGHKVIQHGGAWQRFTCVIQRYVDDNLTLVVLTNLARANPGRFASRIAGFVNPALMPPPPKEHKEVAVDPKLFVGYVGKYQLAPDFILTVTQEGDHLFVQATGQPKFTLFAEGEREFFLKIVDAQITFVIDSQGRATELILHQGGDQHAKRIE